MARSSLFIKIIISLFLFILSLTFSVRNISAGRILFQDNFEDGLDKWKAVRGSIDDWIIKDGMVGTIIPFPSTRREIIPKNQWWDKNWGNYVLEFDMIARSGVDKNFPFRFQGLDRWYEIHHTIDKYGWYRFYLDKVFPNEGGQLASARYSLDTNKPMANDIPYRVKITVNGDDIQFCLREDRGEELCPIQYKDLNTNLKTGRISLKVTSGAVYPTEIWFDNVVVKEIEALPTSLDLPSLSQHDPQWSGKEYDAATVWAPTEPTIERWGCALTSAAMVLRYYKHNVWPDSLNSWLNSQPDGYLRNGLLNWLAVSRYTKVNSNEDSPTLLFRRYKADPSILEEELNQEHPPILKLPGHFVVAKGKQNSDFLINDPASETNTLLSQVETERGGNYSAINTYIPTSTDLSYLMLTIDPGVTLEVYDPDGEKVGNFYVDEPLTDDVDKTYTSGESLGIFLLPTPKEGNYKVRVRGVGDYSLESYFYNQEGEVETSSLKGLIDKGELDEFEISFKGKDSKIVPIVTIGSLLEDLENARKMKLISHRAIYRALKIRLKMAKFWLDRGKEARAKTHLKMAKLLIKIFTPRFIEPKAAEVLTKNLQALIKSL